MRPVEDMPVQGEPLAVELVNTTFVKGGLRGHVVDVLTCPEELLAWLRSRSWDLGPNVVEGLAGNGASDADVDHFRQLRQALRDLFTAETAATTGTATWPDHAIQIVNNAVRGATQWRELSTAAPERSVTVWSSPAGRWQPCPRWLPPVSRCCPASSDHCCVPAGLLGASCSSCRTTPAGSGAPRSAVTAPGLHGTAAGNGTAVRDSKGRSLLNRTQGRCPVRRWPLAPAAAGSRWPPQHRLRHSLAVRLCAPGRASPGSDLLR